MIYSKSVERRGDCSPTTPAGKLGQSVPRDASLVMRLDERSEACTPVGWTCRHRLPPCRDVRMAVHLHFFGGNFFIYTLDERYRGNIGDRIGAIDEPSAIVGTGRFHPIE